MRIKGDGSPYKGDHQPIAVKQRVLEIIELVMGTQDAVHQWEAIVDLNMHYQGFCREQLYVSLGTQ